MPSLDALFVPTMSQSPAATWSTDEVQTQDRFEHWREMPAKRLFGVTIETPKQQQPQFSGRLSAIPVGAATIVEMHAASYKVWRTENDIARNAGDSLCIYQQLDGACWFGTDPATGDRQCGDSAPVRHRVSSLCLAVRSSLRVWGGCRPDFVVLRTGLPIFALPRPSRRACWARMSGFSLVATTAASGVACVVMS